MKKFLLSLACVAAVFPAFAQDATEETATPAEVITENADGTITISDDFVAAGKNDKISNGKHNDNKHLTGECTLSAQWSVQDGAAVQYVGYDAAYNSTNNVYQILAYNGAYLQFTLPGYNCSKFAIKSSGSTKNAVFDVYAGDTKIGSITVASANDDIVFEIDGAYQTAGTVYKIVNANTNKFEDATATNYRIHAIGMEFTCTPKVEPKWNMPTCNVESGDFLVEGQVIRFEWEEDGTLSGKMTYKDKDGESQSVNIENGQLTIPGNLSINANLTITASVSGKGKDKSEVARWDLKFNDKTKLLLVANKQNFTNIEVENNTARFHYDLHVLNYDILAGAVTLQVALTAENGEETLHTQVIRYSDLAAPVAETEGEDTGDTEEAPAEVTPIAPYHLTGVFEVPDIEAGNYTAKMSVKVGSSANGTFTEMPEPESGNAFVIESTQQDLTGIDGIEADDDADAVYYNLNGIRIQPADGMGLVIRVSNGKATKIII